MNLLLVVPSFLLTLLLVVHAVRVRGGRTAAAFFISCFLFGVIRGNSVAFLSPGEDGGPYIFRHAFLSIGRAELPACVGWIFATYLSWCLAERMTGRHRSLEGRVYPVAAFALVAMGAFAYAVETTACSVGWWRWNIVRPATPVLVGGTHLFGIVEWMSVGLDFLVPFLLFRTPRGARYAPAWASLLLYPVHWATHWKQVTATGFPHSYEIYHAGIVFSTILFPLFRSPRLTSPPSRPASPWIRAIPALAVLAMFGVLAAGDAGILGEGELLISMLPLAVLLVDSEWGGRGLAAAATGSALLAVGGSLSAGREVGVALARAIPILVPVAAVVVYGGWEVPARPRRRAAFFALATVAAVLAAAGMIRGKRLREEYSRLVHDADRRIAAGDLAGGEAALKQAIVVKPNVNLATKNLATLYGSQGRMAEAGEYARLSLEIDPSDADAYRIAGNVHRAQGETAAALPFFERALRLNPWDVDSAKALAEAYSRAGRYADALRVLREAAARNPGDADLPHLLGAILLQTGDLREAYRVVSGILARSPDDAPAHLLMAFLQAASGNAAAARAEAERVLELDPSDAQARRLLESLPR